MQRTAHIEKWTKCLVIAKISPLSNNNLSLIVIIYIYIYIHLLISVYIYIFLFLFFFILIPPSSYYVYFYIDSLFTEKFVLYQSRLLRSSLRSLSSSLTTNFPLFIQCTRSFGFILPVLFYPRALRQTVLS